MRTSLAEDTLPLLVFLPSRETFEPPEVDCLSASRGEGYRTCGVKYVEDVGAWVWSEARQRSI